MFKFLFSSKAKFVIIVLFFFVEGVSSQKINEMSFAVADFSNIEYVDALFQRKNEGRIGLSIEVVENLNRSILEVKLKDGNVELPIFLKKLQGHLLVYKKFVFPLFIDFKFDEEKLLKEFENAGLLDFIYVQPRNERWPNKEELIGKAKPLLLFSKNSKSSNAINSIQQNLYNYEWYKERGEIGKSLWNEFLAIHHFEAENLMKNNLPKNWERLSTNPYSINYLLNSWSETGKQPNFIFYSSPVHIVPMFFLTNLLNETKSINGRIKSDNGITHRINWRNNTEAITGGYFSFPYEFREGLTLMPLKEGFRFEPESYLLEKSDAYSKDYIFESTPLDITEGLTAVYKFEHGIENLIKPNLKHDTAIKYVSDKERGEVLKFENESFVQLKNVEDYKLVNSSFTIAINFKYNKAKGAFNYCILGSDEASFRKGLHVNIVAKKLVFGFYTNDTKSDFIVNPNKWYHLVVKYNIDTKTQSIFINGKNVGASSNHPSFIGSSDFLLGHGIKQDNFLNGHLDNLTIWSRALSDEEIRRVAENKVSLEKQKKKGFNVFIVLSIIGFAVLLIVVWLLFKIKKNEDEPVVIKNKLEVKPTKNAIYLFGKFSLLNEKGEDKADSLTPKIKELFLLLLVKTIHNSRGISTAELTNILWGDFTTTKAANNRGVSFNSLRKVLTEIEGVSVVYENKFWKVVLSEGMYIDYKWLYEFVSENMTDYDTFFEVVKRGEFLRLSKSEWQLKVKSNTQFDIIDTLLLLSSQRYKSKKYQKVLKVAEYILKLDDLNAQALHYRLNSLVKTGGKNKALFLFDNFSQKYKLVNSEDFGFKFREFVQTEIDELWN
jgi:hypothetical protein